MPVTRRGAAAEAASPQTPARPSAKQQQQQQQQQQHDGQPVVLVTGCTDGSLGAALARAFDAAGARVFATARRLEAMQGLPAAVGRIKLDVTDDAQCADAVAAVLEATGGRLDVLVNNAGVALPGALLEAPVADLRATLETNTVAPVVLARAAVPAMAKRGGGGVIVNINSIYAHVWSPFNASYCMSKHALRVVSDTLRLELAPYGVKVLDVALGYTGTPMLSKAAATLEGHHARGPTATATAHEAALRAQALIRARAARVDDVAAAIARAALRPGGPPATVWMGTLSWVARALTFAPAWAVTLMYALIMPGLSPWPLPGPLVRLLQFWQR